MTFFQASDYLISGIALLIGCWASLNVIRLPKPGGPLAFANKIRQERGDAAARCFWAFLALVMFGVSATVFFDFRPQFARPVPEQSP